MRLIWSLPIVPVISLLVYSAAVSHEIQAHKDLTKSAVLLLAQKDQRFSEAVNTLSEILSFGAEHEDDFFIDSPKVLGRPILGRFYFHFLPILNDDPPPPPFLAEHLQVLADCDSLSWGFEKNSYTATAIKNLG